MICEIDTGLILVDVQNDFCPGGKLAVPEGDQVVEPLNKMLDLADEYVWLKLASRDFHPPITTHFKAFGGDWPSHCIEGTKGAEFHPDLKVPEEEVIWITKGAGKDENAYSAFDGRTREGETLEEFLRWCRIKRVILGGLATDYCVKATAIDAAKKGFETFVLTDAIKAVNINPDDGAKALTEMAEAGVRFTTTEWVLAHPEEFDN